jgi:hypothetical protein
MMRAQERRINKVLQRAYPDCRIRWSGRDEEWRLERKANYQRTDINPEKYPEDAVDTFIMRRDGYYLAGKYMPRHFLMNHPEILVKVLLANDTTRMDVAGATDEERAANFAKSLEEAETAAKMKVQHDQSFYESGLGAQLYDDLAWAEGRRVAVP